MADDILDSLGVRVRGILAGQSHPVQGFHVVEYRFQWTSEGVPLHLQYLTIISNSSSGCCFFDDKAELGDSLEHLIGRDLLDLNDLPRPVRVAALDAAYGFVGRPPGEVITLKGSPHSKAIERARVVANEALRQLSLVKNTSKPFRMAYVGVVDAIINAVEVNRHMPFSATDFNKAVVGKTLLETCIRPGGETLAAVRNSDVAVVTGMTLGNGTLDEILQVARRSGTRVVIFAQTGANLSSELIKFGANAVVAEPYPFYNVAAGPSDIIVYRQETVVN